MPLNKETKLNQTNLFGGEVLPSGEDAVAVFYTWMVRLGINHFV